LIFATLALTRIV